LHHQWALKLERLREELDELRAQRTSRREELDDALLDLVRLQSDYDCLTVPENFSDSRLQDKLHRVQALQLRETGLAGVVQHQVLFVIGVECLDGVKDGLDDLDVCGGRCAWRASLPTLLP
jgi:hypothetical protein